MIIGIKSMHITRNKICILELYTLKLHASFHTFGERNGINPVMPPIIQQMLISMKTFFVNAASLRGLLMDCKMNNYCEGIKILMFYESYQNIISLNRYKDQTQNGYVAKT